MKRFTLRLPEQLWDKVKLLAKMDYRSLNSQVVHLLETTIEHSISNVQIQTSQTKSVEKELAKPKN